MVRRPSTYPLSRRWISRASSRAWHRCDVEDLAMPSDLARSLTPSGSPPAASSASRIPAALVTAGAGLPPPSAPKRRPPTRGPLPRSSVEMLGVDDIEKFLPVDQPAEVGREELCYPAVLVRTQRRCVRRDDHLRHRP